MCVWDSMYIYIITYIYIYIYIYIIVHTEALLISFFCVRRNAIECQFNNVFSWDPHLSVQCVCGVYLSHICAMIVGIGSV